MRILFIGINYWPDATGIAPFTTGRCEYLASRGHEVGVVTGFPYYPEWRIAPDDRGRLRAREVRNDVTILRSWIYVPSRVTSARRILHEASFVATAWMHAAHFLWRQKPDLLFVVSPPLGLGLVAAILSRTFAIPYLFHVADLQPDAAMDLGMLRPRTASMLYGLERLAYQHAALVSTLTEPIRGRIMAKGFAADKVILFSDWIDPALFKIPLTGGGTAFRRQHGLDDRFIVLHAGNMGVKQGLEVVLGAAEHSLASNIIYLLVGDGAMRQSLGRTARERDLSNVRFLPLQSDETFRDLLAAADLSLITQRSNVADVAFPSKVLTLLASGRPIVASVSPCSEVSRVVEAARAGVVVTPENPQELAEAVISARRDPQWRSSAALQGREYGRRHWDKATVLAELEHRLTTLANRRRELPEERRLPRAQSL